MYQEVIHFWFEEIDKSQWWKTDEQFDRLIESRFSSIHGQAIKGELFLWRKHSLGSLAEIIVLDQFSRNIYRDKPQSFAYDVMSLTLAQSAISVGYDKELETEQRAFVYMPLMHSESLLIHQEAEGLFANLGNTSTIDFEAKHKRIIERFGRYPHRNSILGRNSTPEELKFLMGPGSRF